VWILRSAWIKRAAVIAGLDFACDFWTVGIAMVQQQLACA